MRGSPFCHGRQHVGAFAGTRRFVVINGFDGEISDRLATAGGREERGDVIREEDGLYFVLGKMGMGFEGYKWV